MSNCSAATTWARSISCSSRSCRRFCKARSMCLCELSRSEQLLRRQAEELARAERTFRAVLEAAPDAMVITSTAGIIELANSRADALFGHSREALIGRDIRTLIPGWQCPELVSEASRCRGVAAD